MAIAQNADGTLVVVATGLEAHTFMMKGERLEPSARWTQQDLANEGPSGKTPPDSAPRDLNEATFSKQIAEKLYALAHGDAFRHLILIADPTTLGEIRPLLHTSVTERIILEQAKTLINSPIEDIEASIAADMSR